MSTQCLSYLFDKSKRFDKRKQKQICAMELHIVNLFIYSLTKIIQIIIKIPSLELLVLFPSHPQGPEKNA